MSRERAGLHVALQRRCTEAKAVSRAGVWEASAANNAPRQLRMCQGHPPPTLPVSKCCCVWWLRAARHLHCTRDHDCLKCQQQPPLVFSRLPARPSSGLQDTCLRKGVGKHVMSLSSAFLSLLLTMLPGLEPAPVGYTPPAF